MYMFAATVVVIPFINYPLVIAVLPLLHLFVDTPGLGQGVPVQPSVYFQADNLTSAA